MNYNSIFLLILLIVIHHLIVDCFGEVSMKLKLSKTNVTNQIINLKLVIYLSK